MSSQGRLFTLSREQTGVLKGLAILLVLLEHTRYISFLGPVGVGLFLTLSGYGLELSCEKNGQERFWNKRIRKVWLPYVLVGTFVVLALRVGGVLPILCNVIGLDLGRLADRTMWYISYILLWYLGYDLAYRVSALAPEGPVRQGLKLLLLLAAAFGFRLLAGLGFWHPDANAGVYGFCFPLGVLLSQLSKIRISEGHRTLLWLGILFLSAAYLFRLYPFSFYNPLLITVGILQLLALLQVCRLPVRAEGLLRKLGEYSYAIYLFEGLLLQRRNLWFGMLQTQILIDLAFILSSVAAGVLFWKSYQKLEGLIPWDRWIRF